MAERIKINTGCKVYEIEDQDGNVLGEFKFIPTDTGIVERYENVRESMAQISKAIEGKDIKEAIAETERTIREKLDYLFNAPVSDSFFSVAAPLTPLASGETFAEQIISAVGMIISKELAERKEAIDRSREKVKKHTAKYK